MVDPRRMPAALRTALATVLLGVVVAAVGDLTAIVVKFHFAAAHPATDWRNDLGLDAILLTVVLAVSWVAGAGLAVGAAALAARGRRAGHRALTVVLAVFLVYGCAIGYHGFTVWDQVGTGTSDPDFINRNGLLPYLGGLRVAFDLALWILALLPLVLLWTPGTRRFFRPGVSTPESFR